MKIIFSEEGLPSEEIIKNMELAGSLCLKEEGVNPEYAEVSVSFVDLSEIQLLNALYREKDTPTDVLSFPQYESLEEIKKEEKLILGDVVICLEIASMQANEYNHSTARELVYLFVHSIYHLLGYDHMKESDKKVMREKEETIMRAVGLERE